MINKRLLSLAVAGSMLLGLSGLAAAGIPSDANSTATIVAGPSTPVVLVTPAGTGATLLSVGAQITVTVMDAVPAPIAGYPFQDIWVDDVGNGDIALCQGGSVADFNTNAAGITTISGAIAGGGFTQAGLQVYLAGTPLTGPALIVDINSPDITGDLVVDLADIGEFSIDFAAGPPGEFRSDYVPDGVIDLADIGELGIHNNEQCP